MFATLRHGYRERNAARLAAMPPAIELSHHVLNACGCLWAYQCHKRSVELAQQLIGVTT